MDFQLAIIAVPIWFCAFLLLGQTVAICLMGAGLLGLWLLKGTVVLDGLLGQDIFYSSSSYTLSIIPLYLFMAQLLLRGGVIADLFYVGHKLSGFRRFPLGAATIVTGGLLGAVSGSGSASAAALATLASPELERLGYTRRFSVGLAAIAGSLSAIIPPSLIIIVYGSITMVPVGHLFIGSIGPALLLITTYMICLALFGEVRPQNEPPSPVASPTARGAAQDVPNKGALLSFVFVLILMAMIFGGIYGGVITVGEAGAIGAFTALIGMIAMRRVNLSDVGNALSESVKVTAMLMMLVISAQIFARFLSLSRIPRMLLEFAEPLLAQPSLLVAIFMLTIFIGGMILESAALIVLLMPIITPMLQAAGVDLLWFGVLASFMISLGLLTPPVGLSSYSAASAAKVPVSEVFRSGMLFASIAGIFVTGLLILFPQIITWLPSQLG